MNPTAARPKPVKSRPVPEVDGRGTPPVVNAAEVYPLAEALGYELDAEAYELYLRLQGPAGNCVNGS